MKLLHTFTRRSPTNPEGDVAFEMEALRPKLQACCILGLRTDGCERDYAFIEDSGEYEATYTLALRPCEKEGVTVVEGEAA